MEESTLKKIALWALGDDTGMSSKFLASCALGEPLEYAAIPHDDGDFGRCYRFTEILSEEERANCLRVAAEKSPDWGLIAGRWSDLVESHLAGDGMAVYKWLKSQGL